MLKWLLWPDTHFPREDKAKVRVMLKMVKEWQPDAVTFLGDLDDMEAPSRWAAGTKEEVEQRVSKTAHVTAEFLRELRGTLPDARIHWTMGNHEHRLYEYVRTKAKALEGFVTYDLLWPLKELGIEWSHYNAAPVKMYGDYYVTHGSAVSQHSGQSGQKELEKYGVNGFSAHTHRLGMYTKTNMAGKFEWYECGHLCNVGKMDYTTEPNWQAGFAYAYVDGKKVYPSLVPFVGNTIVMDGKKFS